MGFGPHPTTVTPKSRCSVRCLLSVDAANLVWTSCDAEDFYVPAHQAVYEAIFTLYNGGQPIDAITSPMSCVVRTSWSGSVASAS